ncbi:hypothetical protein [Streptomyces murinus]|uniref:hypothetical protein n=1 Tax=Streptomyces murinus TaxID=33900 RepID=UPI0037F68255
MHFSQWPSTHIASRKNSPRELLVSAGGLLLLGSLPTLLNSVLSSAFVFGGVLWPRSVLTLVEAVNITTTVLQLMWLARLLSARVRAARLPHRVFLILAFSAVGILAAGGLLRHPVGPYLHEYPVRAALLAWLCYELYRWHGIPLSAPAAAGSRAVRWEATWQMTKTVFSYCGIGGSGTFMAVLALRSFGPQWLPVMRTSQLTALGGFSAPDMVLFAVAWTVVLEGSVIGATAILLCAARRPSWQIYGIVAAVEIIFHSYFGVPALFIGVYAVLCTRFYVRDSRFQIVPLLAGHAIFDTVGLLVSSCSLPERICIGAALSIVVSVGECWLAVKTGRRAKFFMRPRLPQFTLSFRTVRPPADIPAADRSMTGSEIS